MEHFVQEPKSKFEQPAIWQKRAELIFGKELASNNCSSYCDNPSSHQNLCNRHMHSDGGRAGVGRAVIIACNFLRLNKLGLYLTIGHYENVANPSSIHLNRANGKLHGSPVVHSPV